MRNSGATDDDQSDRNSDVLVESPNLWAVVEELERGLVADSRIVLPDPPQPRVSGFILAALSWLLQFFIEGFAVCGYAMCPYVIDSNETFESWEERTRPTKQEAAPLDGGVSREAFGKW